MGKLSKHTTIKSWAKEDRPREKLVLQGREHLTDAELVAILLRLGSAQESAVDLAKRILASVDNNLFSLGKLTISDLTKFKGIGETKAVTVISALELGRRRNKTTPSKRSKITCSNDAYIEIKPRIYDINHEQFWILLLNRANEIITCKKISSGGVSGTVVDAKIIFKEAIDHLASSVILCHNHPSGNLNASQADINITKKLVEGAKHLDLKIIDHLIVSEAGYSSMADDGLI